MAFVWTDFGGVLTPPISASMGNFCARYGIAVADLRRALRTLASMHGASDAMSLIDTGRMPEKEWLSELSELLEGAFALDTLADVWFDNRPPNQLWIDTLRAHKARGVGIGLISNMVPTWDAHWRRMLGGTELFEHVVLSFEIGVRKPDPSIFRHASQLAGVEPADCLLVDDLPENCEGARAAGWSAVEFSSTQTAIDMLELSLKRMATKATTEGRSIHA